jgi:LPS sulfotransferase NodH
LIRDPRDVVASWVDAHKKGSWRSNAKGPENSDQRTLKVSERYVRHVGAAKRAYEAHEGRKVLVKYEELRADTAGTMKRIYSELGIPANAREVDRAVTKHAWENISEKDKGEGKFYRKAKPGGWSEDLTPEQVETVEKITAPLLEAFYPDTR